MKQKRICTVGTAPLTGVQFLPAFMEFGYDICCFPSNNWGSESYQSGVDKIESLIKKLDIDLLLFAGTYPQYFLEIPKICKKYNCKFMYWAIEDPICFDRTIGLAKLADFVFTTTYECIEKYKENDVEAELLIFACNPKYHDVGKFNENYNWDCVLQASNYVWNARQIGMDIILNPVLDIVENIAIFGAGWDNENGKKRLGDKYDKFKGYFPNWYLSDLCASSKIVLGIQCDDSSISQLSMRPFEILSCGGFHLTQYTKATVNIFEDGKHLLVSNSEDETKEILKYYLNDKHETERNKIRMHGCEYVRQNHTYYHRVKNVVLPHINKFGGF